MGAQASWADRSEPPGGGRAAVWLRLAAAPTFVVMALLTGVSGGGAADILCSTAQGASPLNGMALMYALMSAFHSAPWLALLSKRRRLIDAKTA